MAHRAISLAHGLVAITAHAFVPLDVQDLAGAWSWHRSFVFCIALALDIGKHVRYERLSACMAKQRDSR